MSLSVPDVVHLGRRSDGAWLMALALAAAAFAGAVATVQHSRSRP